MPGTVSFLRIPGIAFDHPVMPHHVEIPVAEIVCDLMEVSREGTAIATELDRDAGLAELGHLRGWVVAADTAAEDEIPCGAHRCGGFGDFIDIVIDSEGRPWAALSHNPANRGLAATMAEGPALRGELRDLPPLPLGGPSTL